MRDKRGVSTEGIAQTEAHCPMPSEWTFPDPKKMVAFYASLRDRATKGERRGPSSSSWNFTDTISPLDLYCYLKVRFGEPNGFMMMLKAPSIDNLCHWQYSLEGEGAIIDLLGLNLRTEIRVYERVGVEEGAWMRLESELQKEFAGYRVKMKKVSGDFEHWHLFINPYSRLLRIVDKNVSRLKEIDIAGVAIPAFPKSPAEFKQYAEQLEAAQEKYREAMAITTSLQLMAPVMAEAGLNLIMLLLARPDVKADRRLYEDFVRRNIDVRVKSLHLCCIGFDHPIAGSDEAFKQFLRLMNRRNDALHGNVDPTASTGDEISFDRGNIPLVKRYRTVVEVALANGLASAKPDDAIRDVNIAKDFIAFLVSRVQADWQELVQRALEEEQLGYRPKTGRVGIILPSAQMDFIPGPSDEVTTGDDNAPDGIAP